MSGQVIYYTPQAVIILETDGNYRFMFPDRDRTGSIEFTLEPQWLENVERIVNIARNYHEHGILPDSDLGGIHGSWVGPRKRMDEKDY